MTHAQRLLTTWLLAIGVCCSTARPIDPTAVTANAKALADATTSLKRGLIVVDEAIPPGKLQPDAALDAKLAGAVGKLEVTSAHFRALHELPNAELTGDVVELFVKVGEIRTMLETHLKTAKVDQQAFALAKTQRAAALVEAKQNVMLEGMLRYAVLAVADERGDHGAKLVELGPPMCGAKVSMTGKCPDGEPPTGYTYRATPTAVWTRADMSMSGDSLPNNHLVLLLPSTILDGLVQGNAPTLAELLYNRRLTDLRQRITSVVDLANKVEARLRQVAAAAS